MEVSRKVWVHFVAASSVWVGLFTVGGIGGLVYFFRFFLLQEPNGPIFPVTISMVWLTFLTVWWRRRDLGFKGFIVAGCAPFGGAGLYEIAQDAVGQSAFGWRFDPMGLFDLAVWVAVGLTGVYYWKRGKTTLTLALLFVIGFLAWGLIGFPQITASQPEPVAFAFNVALKVLSFLIFLVPLSWRASTSRRA